MDETLAVPSAPDAVGTCVPVYTIDGDNTAEKLDTLLSDDILLSDPKSVELEDDATDGD